MKVTIRLKLLGVLAGVLFAGTIASFTVLSMISRSVDQLNLVIEREDVVAVKAVQIRLAMLEMSDAMRGFLLDPTNQAELARKASADSTLVSHVQSLTQLAPSRDVVQQLDQLGAFDAKKLNPIEDDILHLARTNRVAEARVDPGGEGRALDRLLDDVWRHEEALEHQKNGLSSWAPK